MRKPKRKRCASCGALLPASAYHRRTRSATGLESRCKTCRYLDTVARRYGLSPDELHVLAGSQGGRCAICRRHPGERRLVIDHDHLTGDVRGLLCHPCNVGIGHLQDSELHLRRAADYLRRHARDPDAVSD